MTSGPTHAESVEDALTRPEVVLSLHLHDEDVPSIAIDPRIVELVALSSLHIGSNRTDVAAIVGLEALRSVPTLRALSLSFSAAPGPALPSAIFDLVQLHALSLRGRWPSLPAAIGRLVDLRRLDLQMHALERLPDSIGELRNLTHLSLRGCRLETLPTSLSELRSLGDLLAEGNRLRELPAGIEQLTALGHLLLRSNALVTVPASLASLPKLRLLDLMDNPPLGVVPLSLATRPGLRLEIEPEKLPEAGRDETREASARAFVWLEEAARAREREAWILLVEPGDGTLASATVGRAPIAREGEDAPRCGICEMPMSPWLQLDLAGTSEGEGVLELWGCEDAPALDRLRAIAVTQAPTVAAVYRANLRDFFASVPEEHWLGVVERARTWNTTQADRQLLKAAKGSGNSLEYTLRFACRELTGDADRPDVFVGVFDSPSPTDAVPSRAWEPTRSGQRRCRDVALAAQSDRPTVDDLAADEAWERYDQLTEERRGEVSAWTISDAKIGGWPRWLAEEDWPPCPICGEPTTRLVASIGGDGEGLLGRQLEGAVLYVLACDAHPRALRVRMQGG